MIVKWKGLLLLQSCKIGNVELCHSREDRTFTLAATEQHGARAKVQKGPEQKSAEVVAARNCKNQERGRSAASDLRWGIWVLASAMTSVVVFIPIARECS